MAELVIDASAMVDLLLGGPLGEAVGRRLRGHALHAPAHLAAEVLSALGRLSRADALAASDVDLLLVRLAAAPVVAHPVSGLLEGAWARRSNLRLADALYVELADALGLALVTTDGRLAPHPTVEVVAA